MKIFKVHIEPQGRTVEVRENTPLKEIAGQAGIDFPCGGKGHCGNCHVELLSGVLKADDVQKALLRRKGLSEDRWRIACLCKVEGDIAIRIPDRSQVILSDNARATRPAEEGHAVAVDLGSTTVVTQLIDRMTGEVLETESEINVQNRYGADIISRIAYAMQGASQAETLTASIREQTGRMISHMLENTGITDIRKVVIVGNSVMHHLFNGYDVTPLSAYPFNSDRNGEARWTPAGLGWRLPEDCEIVFMPNISHFVGSDILAGILQCGIHKSGKWSALIDLGTNGEIVIGNRDRILCTSTAAGPAFEGVNIINGMRAVSGAICKVDADTGEAAVIGDTAPAGICGSGLVDAVHHFVKTGRITTDGRIADESLDRLPVKGDICLYDKDIREFQLAKSAIATGFVLLAAQAGVRPEEIEHVYIAGGLGNYVDIGKAAELGLISGARRESMVKAGNSALSGCREMTFDSAREEAAAIMPLLSHYSLETDPGFQDSFCDNLYF